MNQEANEKVAAPAPVEQDELPDDLRDLFPLYSSDGEAMNDEARKLDRLAAPASAEPAIDLNSIEQYRMQMAAISTAALGYWTEAEGIKPEYDTVALRDVAKLYAKYAALHAAAPSVPGGESESVDTPDLRELIGDVYRAGSYNESIEASENALVAHVARQVQAARDRALEEATRWRVVESAGSELTLRLHNSRPDRRKAVVDEYRAASTGKGAK